MRVITGIDPRNENFVSFELTYDSRTNKIASKNQNIREFLEKRGFIKKPQ